MAVNGGGVKYHGIDLGLASSVRRGTVGSDSSCRGAGPAGPAARGGRSRPPWGRARGIRGLEVAA
jgi:hypothetical protein